MGSWEKYGIDPNGDLTHDPRVSVSPPANMAM